MSTATITPLPDYSAVFELNGMVHHFASYALAETEARRLDLPFRVDPFPAPRVDVIASVRPACP